MLTEQISIRIGNFQEGTYLRTDISETGLGGCFRNFKSYNISTNIKDLRDQRFKQKLCFVNSEFFKCKKFKNKKNPEKKI